MKTNYTRCEFQSFDIEREKRKKKLNKLRASVKYLSTDADHPINFEKIEIFISSLFFTRN